MSDGSTLPWDRTQTPAIVETDGYGLPVAGFLAALNDDGWQGVTSIAERLTGAGYWPAAWQRHTREAAVVHLLRCLGWRGLDAPLVAALRLPDDTVAYKLLARISPDEAPAVRAEVQREANRACSELADIVKYVKAAHAAETSGTAR
jgi:hypothetical protein